MLREVRGLKSGVYWNKDDNARVDIIVNDDGIKITMADYEVDTFWEFLIDPKTSSVVESGIGSIAEGD